MKNKEIEMEGSGVGGSLRENKPYGLPAPYRQEKTGQPYGLIKKTITFF